MKHCTWPKSLDLRTPYEACGRECFGQYCEEHKAARRSKKQPKPGSLRKIYKMIVQTDRGGVRGH